MTIRDGSNRYLQADGTVSSTGYTFRITPDVVGAKSTTWSQEITVPTKGTWKAQARAVDTAGQSDLDTADRDLDRQRGRRGTDGVDQRSPR